MRTFLFPNRLLRILLLVLMSQTTFAQSIDSLEKVLPSLQGKDRLPVLGDLCFYLSATDIGRAEKYGREAVQIATSLGDSALVASAANDLSTCLYRKGDYDGALANTYRALAIRRKSGDKKAIGSSLNKLVNIFNERVMLDSALKYALENVAVFEAAGDSLNWAISLNTLASVYVKERDWASVKRFAAEGYRIADEVGHPYPMAGGAGNLAVAEEEMGNLEEAVRWYEIALKNFEIIDSQVDIATVAGNLGVIYRKQGKTQEALASYIKALDMTTAIGEQNGMAHHHANLGSIYNDLGEFQKAEHHFTEALNIAEAQQIGRVRLQAYDGLAEAYAKSGRGPMAYEMMDKYKSLRDSLYTSERSEQLQEMRTKYETEKKEQENLLLQAENEMKQRENRYLLFGSVAIIILLILSAVLYYRSYKRKQEVRLQSELVKEREAGLRAVFDATEEERKRIAKDLHDGIGQQLGGLKLSWESLKSKISGHLPNEQQVLSNLTSVLDDTAKDVRTLSHQMMPRSLQENGLLPAIEDVLKKSFGLTGITYRLEHFKVEGQRFDDRVEIGLYRICQELINNIIKHSGATEVAVQLFRNKNILILVVEDNGRGFDTGAKKDGIGLMNIASRLSTVHGEVSWEPSPGSGTVATVRIPIK